jgi:hypothetical protein
MAKILDFLQSNGMVKVLLAVIILVIIYFYMKGSFFESLENTDSEDAAQYIQVPEEQVSQEQVVQQPSLALGVEEPLEQQQVVDEQQQQIEKVVAGTAQLGAEDLLPKYDDANEFAKENPVSKLLKEQNFLISGYHVGVNTVMQSNKIPYHDIRSLPPVPKENVGPWNQSSYEQSPAQLRRQFEIGV